MLLGVIGYWGVLHSPNMLVFTISMMVISATNIIFPYIYGAVMEDVPATSKDFFLSLAKVFNNGGAFISPYTMALTASILHLSGPMNIIRIVMWYLVFVGIVFVILAIIRNNRLRKTTK